VMKQSIVGN